MFQYDVARAFKLYLGLLSVTGTCSITIETYSDVLEQLCLTDYNACRQIDFI